jgi:hypothetical protein
MSGSHRSLGATLAASGLSTDHPTLDKFGCESLFLPSMGVEVLKFDEGERMVRFEDGLVLGHFLQQGDFWNEIKAMRERWNITAVPGFPPRPTGSPHPFPNPAERR